MASQIPCKHCHGTTFCSCFREANGKLKTRPSCICCVVKAGLDPRGIYDKVICSVCGGSAVVNAAKASPLGPRKTSNRGLIAIVACVLSMSLIFFLSSVAYNYRDRHKDDEKRNTERDAVTGQMPVGDVRPKVMMGMRKEEVKKELGAPARIREISVERETWTYKCKDGPLNITFTNGLVSDKQ